MCSDVIIANGNWYKDDVKTYVASAYLFNVWCRDGQKLPAHEPVVNQPIPIEKQLEVRDR